MNSDLLIALVILCVALAPVVRLMLRNDGSAGSAAVLGVVAAIQFALLSAVYLGIREPLREAYWSVQVFALVGFGSIAWLSGKLIERWKPVRLARERMLDAQERASRADQSKLNTYQPMVLNGQ